MAAVSALCFRESLLSYKMRLLAWRPLINLLKLTCELAINNNLAILEIAARFHKSKHLKPLRRLFNGYSYST